MGARASQLILLSIFAVALAACSHSTPKAVQPNLFPSDYRNEIVSTLKNLFKKNETIRVTDAYISAPVLTQVGKTQLYSACVRYTAHGTSPGIVGTAIRIAYFYGGHLNQLIPATDDRCKTAAYQPFPELAKVCLGKGCQSKFSF